MLQVNDFGIPHRLERGFDGVEASGLLNVMDHTFVDYPHFAFREETSETLHFCSPPAAPPQSPLTSRGEAFGLAD